MDQHGLYREGQTFQKIANAEQIEMLVGGMETLVGLLGSVVMGLGQERH